MMFPETPIDTMATADTERLTPFGRLVERLREIRGYSKHGLAQRIGVSRVHLWRATVGKTRLSDRELDLLAQALGVPVARLTAPLTDDINEQWEPTPDELSSTTGSTPADEAIEDYLSNLERVLVTLRNFPGGPLGQRLKIGYLNAIEDIAREVGERLPPTFWDLRRRVHDGEI